MRRILVVEYDRSVALTLRDGLQRLPDCEVTVAIDAGGALQLCEQKAFDVLITDYKMPGMDGLALTARVRELCPRTRVIMVTGYRDDALSQEPAAALVRSILDRPVALDVIRSAVSEALDRAEPLGHNGPSVMQERTAGTISPSRVHQGCGGRPETADDLSAVRSSFGGIAAAGRPGL
jgi:CheY-like chemotaxis protein